MHMTRRGSDCTSPGGVETACISPEEAENVCISPEEAENVCISPGEGKTACIWLGEAEIEPQTNERTDRRMGRQMNRQIDKQMDGQAVLQSLFVATKDICSCLAMSRHLKLHDGTRCTYLRRAEFFIHRSTVRP